MITSELTEEVAPEPAPVEPEPEPVPEPVSEPSVEELPDLDEPDAPAPTPVEPDPEPVAPGAETPAEEGEEDLVSLYEARLAKQQELIAKLMGGESVIEQPKDAPAPAQPVPVMPAQSAAPAPAPAPEPPKPLVDEETFDAILSDAGKFNTFLEQTVKNVREEAIQEAYSMALTQLPQAIMPTINENVRSHYAVQGWVASNPIVSQNKQVAAAILEQVDGTYPDLPLEKKLEMTLNSVNQYLGAPSAPAQRAVPGTAKPAFARPPRGGKPKPKALDPLQAELDELTV